jgi:hypothetical protein
MQTRSIIILSTIIFALFVWTSSAVSQTTETRHLKSVYSTAIDKAIAHCKAKTSYRNSKSENLQHTAALSSMKAAFFNDFKVQLIEGMIQASIGTKPYKIHYYLNQKFYGIIHLKVARLH